MASFDQPGANAPRGGFQSYSYSGYSQSQAPGYSFQYQGQYHQGQYQGQYQGQAAPQQQPEMARPQPEGAPQQPQGPNYGKMASILGAVASLALIVGVGVWSYKLIARDVSGVPVVRAAAGEMRVHPADPGGRPADHQGLAVNAVAAQGTAAAPADQLRLAPSPVGLTEEDLPEGHRLQQPAPGDATVSVSEDAVAAFRSGQVDALVSELTGRAPSLLEDTPSAITASVPQIVQPEPLQPLVDSQTEPEPRVARVAPDVITGPGLARSLRPIRRPARVVAAAGAVSEALKTATPTSAATPVQREVDASALPPGTRLAQLGAYDSPEVARAEWDRLNATFGDFLQGKQRVIQMASSGGRTFYRLRAMGFKDLSDARRFCSALVAGNADCIPVVTR
jgi:hypothetical protein